MSIDFFRGGNSYRKILIVASVIYFSFCLYVACNSNKLSYSNVFGDIKFDIDVDSVVFFNVLCLIFKDNINIGIRIFVFFILTAMSFFLFYMKPQAFPLLFMLLIFTSAILRK